VSCTRTDVIAFTRGFDSTAKIHLVHANGAGPLVLASGSDATWSPDGRSLAFRQLVCIDYYYYYPYCYSLGIHTTLVQGWSPMRIATDEEGPAAWSPDGTTLIFARSDGITSTLHKVTVSTRIVTHLTIVGFTGAASQPAWSPDGTRIAFACRQGDIWDICVANADGSGFQRVTDDPQSDLKPAWSPDGTRLAFTTDGNRIVLIGADGTGRQEVTDGLDPSWSPDGTRLVFVGWGGTGNAYAPGLYLINVDGSGLFRLTLDSSDRTPSWRQ
jgi:TolB protein